MEGFFGVPLYRPANSFFSCYEVNRSAILTLIFNVRQENWGISLGNILGYPLGYPPVLPGGEGHKPSLTYPLCFPLYVPLVEEGAFADHLL